MSRHPVQFREDPNKRYIFVSSNDRNFESDGGFFQMSLTSVCKNVKKLSLEYMCFPISWHIFDDELCHLPISEDNGTTGPSFNVTNFWESYVRPTPQQVALSIANTVTAKSATDGLGYTYNCSYEPMNDAFTITSTGNFSLQWTTDIATNPLNYTWRVLGFGNETNTLQEQDADTSYATSHTSTGAAVFVLNEVFATITPLTFTPFNTTNSLSINICCPLLGNSYDRVYFMRNSGFANDLYFSTKGTNILDINLRMTFDNGRVIDLRGGTVSMVFSYESWDDLY